MDLKLDMPKVLQVGIVVRDLDKALDFYTKVLGWGPFDLCEVDQSHMRSAYYGGEQYSGKLRIALTPWGSEPQIELIQPLSGDNVYTRHLREHGEGLHHLFAGLVEDLDVLLPELEQQGIRTIMFGKVPEFGARAAYVVGERTGNIILEFGDQKI